MKDGKKRKYVDLHIHSTYSDGSLSIREIVEQASTRQLSAVSLTDHDCVAGVQELKNLADTIGVEVVPGVEISSLHENSDVHILGYYFDIHNPDLVARLDEIRAIRIERAKKIVERLNNKGVLLRFERVQEFSKGYSLGRPHIASALIAEEHVDSVAEAFDRYLGNHTEFYIPIQKLTPVEAIALIKKAGGMAVMAHPHVTARDDLLEAFVKQGLDGLEVFHPKMPYGAFKSYRQFCHKHNLLETGGSDSHGSVNGEPGLGMVRTPYTALEKMKKRKGLI